MFRSSCLSVLFGLALVLHGCVGYGVQEKEISGRCYYFPGNGGNSGLIISDSIALVIDTKMKVGANQLQKCVAQHLKDQKVYVVNTHIHRDHTSGNHLYPNATIIAGDYGKEFWYKLNAAEDTPSVWLTDTMTLNMDGENILIENIGRAHTFDDVIVYLPERKILFAGDIVLNGYHPFLDEDAGADVEGYLSALKYMNTLDVSVVVPGHGKPGDKKLITDMITYFNDMEKAANDPDYESQMREKYRKYESLPITKAGFDQTIEYIRKSGTLR